MSGRTRAPFKALEGLNRLGTAVKKATATHTNNVGVVQEGSVVEVELDGASPSTGSVTVRERATGAICLGWSAHPSATSDTFTWVLDGTTLDVQGPNGNTDTLYFWVF